MAENSLEVKNQQIQDLIGFGRQLTSLQSLETVAQAISFLNSTKEMDLEVRDIMKLAIIGWLISRKRMVDGDQFMEVDTVVYMNAAHIIACAHGLDVDNEDNFRRFVKVATLVNK